MMISLHAQSATSYFEKSYFCSVPQAMVGDMRLMHANLFYAYRAEVFLKAIATVRDPYEC